MSSSNVDFLLEFWECCIHTVLHKQRIYPREIFEERIMYHIPVFQSRHPDVNNYIGRVLNNARPIVEARAAEKLMMEVKDSVSGKILYQISFDYSLDTPGTGNSSASSSSSAQCSSYADSSVQILQEELRNSLIKLIMSCEDLPASSQKCTWSLGLLTSLSSPADASVDAAVKSGEWYVDNSKIPESKDMAATASRTGGVIPVMQFSARACRSDIYIHVF